MMRLSAILMILLIVTLTVGCEVTPNEQVEEIPAPHEDIAGDDDLNIDDLFDDTTGVMPPPLPD